MKSHGHYKLRYRRDSDRGDPMLLEPDAGNGFAADAGNGIQADVAGALALPGDAIGGLLEELDQTEDGTKRLLDSLREEILAAGGDNHLRIRQVFQTPREVYRVELTLPDHSYQRTTFLDREALESLLEADDVRSVVERSQLGQAATGIEPSNPEPEIT